jgi:hypothetical protein
MLCLARSLLSVRYGLLVREYSYTCGLFLFWFCLLLRMYSPPDVIWTVPVALEGVLEVLDFLSEPLWVTKHPSEYHFHDGS